MDKNHDRQKESSDCDKEQTQISDLNSDPADSSLEDLSIQQLDKAAGGRAGKSPFDGWISIKWAKERLK